MASFKLEGESKGEAVASMFHAQSSSQASTATKPVRGWPSIELLGNEATRTREAAAMAVDALEQHKCFMRATLDADLAKDAFGLKKALWKDVEKKQRAAWLAGIKRELILAEGTRTKWTKEAFRAAKLSAGASLCPILGELRPEDEEDIFAAMRDENAVEAASETRDTKLNLRAARQTDAEILKQRAALIEQSVVSSVSILKNARVVAASVAKASSTKPRGIQPFAANARYYVNKEAETREQLASAELDIKHGEAMEAVELEWAAAKKARAAAFDALAKANRTMSLCEKTFARLSSLRCGAAWGWPAAGGEEVPSSPPLGVRVYRPKGGMRRVFARLLTGHPIDVVSSGARGVSRTPAPSKYRGAPTRTGG